MMMIQECTDPEAKRSMNLVSEKIISQTEFKKSWIPESRKRFSLVVQETMTKKKQGPRREGLSEDNYRTMIEEC